MGVGEAELSLGITPRYLTKRYAFPFIMDGPSFWDPYLLTPLALAKGPTSSPSLQQVSLPQSGTVTTFQCDAIQGLFAGLGEGLKAAPFLGMW